MPDRSKELHMTTPAHDLSRSLAESVARAGAGVVSVDARRRFPASGIAWSEDLVVTAHHVVERDEDLSVGRPDGTSVPASLVGRDPARDLAVLRADGAGLAPPAWSDGEGLAVGQLALGVGRPGDDVRAALGIVAVLGGAWRTPAGGRIGRFVQPDLVMYPGFSGGALAGADGEILGVLTSGLLRRTAVAVPTEAVRESVASILEHGEVRRGWLGIGAQVVRLPDAAASDLGQETGILLVGVVPGGPAEAAGLHLGDTLVRLDGEPVRHADDLLDLLDADTVGRELPVEILRGGARSTLAVTVAARPTEHEDDGSEHRGRRFRHGRGGPRRRR